MIQSERSIGINHTGVNPGELGAKLGVNSSRCGVNRGGGSEGAAGRGGGGTMASSWSARWQSVQQVQLRQRQLA